MSIKIRKYKRLNEDDQAQAPAPDQNQQNNGQQQQQQQQQPQGDGPNYTEIKNQIIKANETILQVMLEAIDKNAKPIQGVGQADQKIEGSEAVSKAYQNLTQNKNYNAVGQFLTALNNYGASIVKLEQQAQGQPNQEGNDQNQQQQQQNQQQNQQQPQQQNGVSAFGQNQFGGLSKAQQFDQSAANISNKWMPQQ